MARPSHARTLPGKRAVNLSIAAELIEEARAEGINLSATLERALENTLRQARRDRWLAENATAISAYNDQVVEHGVFGDSLRSF